MDLGMPVALSDFIAHMDTDIEESDNLSKFTWDKSSS